MPSISDDKVELSIRQGSTFDQSMYRLNDDETPASLAGWNARMQVRETPNAPDIVLSATSEGGSPTLLLGQPRFVGDPDAAAHLRILIPASTMEDVPSGTYAFDIELYKAEVGGERVETFVAGTLIVDREVTR